MYVCRECCVLSGRGLRNGPITRPQEYYRLWCVVVYDLETSWMRRPWPSGGLSHKKKTVTRDWQWRNCSSTPDYVSYLLYVVISQNPLTSLFVTYPIRALPMLPSHQCFIGPDWTWTDWTSDVLSIILRHSRTGTVWFYTSTSNKRAARPNCTQSH